MQGLFINGSRPRTKKQIKEQLARINRHLQDPETYPQGHPEADDPYSVVIEATSMFGNEFDGSLALAMKCTGSSLGACSTQEEHQHLGPFYLVGPDPYTQRNWYAKLWFDANNNEWGLS